MTRALDRFFFAPHPVAPLVLCRILLGAALFLHYATRAFEYPELLGADGLCRHMGVGDFFVPASWTPWLLGLTLLSTASFTLGLLTPLAGLVAAACHFNLNELVQLEWGWRNVIHALLVYVALSGAGGAYSLDALWRQRRHGAPALAEVPAWPLRLVQFHLTAIYVAASYHRLDDPGWLKGQMVFEALAMSLWSRFPGVDFFEHRAVLELGSHWAFALELLAPFALWITRFRIRTLMVVNLLAMHALLGIASLLGLWQPMMIAALACFAPPEWSRRLLEVVSRLAGGLRSSAR